MREGYLTIAEQNNERVSVINADQPIEDIQVEIKAVLTQML